MRFAHDTAPDWIASVHPDRLGEALRPLVPTSHDLCAMLAMPRLRGAIVQVLARRFALAYPENDGVRAEADRAVMGLPVAQWEALPVACGIALWRHAIVNEIRQPQRQRLQTELGDDVFARAIDYVETLPALSRASMGDPSAAAVRRDGHACVAAWVAEQPAGWAGWLALKSSASGTGAAHALQATVQPEWADIVRPVAAALALTTPDIHHE